MHNTQKGVTLVEIMVAMGILAVLAAIAVPAYRGYIQSSRTTECINNLASIRLAQEEYFLENNRYFPDPDGNVQVTGTPPTAITTLLPYWSPAENISERNCDYSVVSSSNGTTYTATATGRGGNFTVPSSFSRSISK